MGDATLFARLVRTTLRARFYALVQQADDVVLLLERKQAAFRSICFTLSEATFRVGIKVGVRCVPTGGADAVTLFVVTRRRSSAPRPG
ncbi:MAG: hypothetical protein IPG23_10710 [Burkholderiales bacterium]|nr:hypothetical protein [Burkholderiales bacterium]